MAKKSNYFENNIQKYGVDFLDYKSAEEIQRDAKFIFRDMVYGNINYEKHGMYFMESRFLEQLIIVASIDARKHAVKYFALSEFRFNHANDPNCQDPIITELINIECDLKIIMETIYNYLVTVKSSNFNISGLIYLPAILKQHKKSFKEY